MFYSWDIRHAFFFFPQNVLDHRSSESEKLFPGEDTPCDNRLAKFQVLPVTSLAFDLHPYIITLSLS